MAKKPVPSEAGGIPDGHPPPGICVDCKALCRFTWEVESLGIRLCSRHIRERIRIATWPNPPRWGDS